MINIYVLNEVIKQNERYSPTSRSLEMASKKDIKISNVGIKIATGLENAVRMGDLPISILNFVKSSNLLVEA
jgi:hypothetical protein